MLHLRRRRHGATLIEMLISCGLILLVMLVLQQCWSLINQTQYSQDARVTARQFARSAFTEIGDVLHSSQYVWTTVNSSINLAYPGNASNTQGINYDYTPGTAPQDPNWGPPLPVVSPKHQDQLLFAAPDTNGGTTFTVHAIYIRDRVPADIRSPGAKQIVWWSKQFITPPTANTPASIVLTTMGTGNAKIYDTYVPPNGFRIWVNSAATAVKLEAIFKVSAIDSPPEFETFFTEVQLRNHP